MRVRNENWKIVSQGYLAFPGAFCEQQTTGHLAFNCAEYAYGWRKAWPELSFWCQNTAAVPKRYECHVLDGKLSWGDEEQQECDN